MSRINNAVFDDLNAERRAAVEHGLKPLLVIARAGVGEDEGAVVPPCAFGNASVALEGTLVDPL